MMLTLVIFGLFAEVAFADGDCDPDTGYEAVDADADGWAASEDCDDANPSANPGVDEESCNGLDDNCDCQVDAYELDQDGDGQRPCEGDCDDANASRYAGAPEMANRVDDDCDGLEDEGTVYSDDDGDGYPEEIPGTAAGGEVFPVDCDDTDPDINPGVVDAADPPDGVDNDCDGSLDEGDADQDLDGDGFTPLLGDCDDTRPEVFPGAVEINDNLDNDCDGAQPVVQGCGGGSASAALFMALALWPGRRRSRSPWALALLLAVSWPRLASAQAGDPAGAGATEPGAAAPMVEPVADVSGVLFPLLMEARAAHQELLIQAAVEMDPRWAVERLEQSVRGTLEDIEREIQATDGELAAARVNLERLQAQLATARANAEAASVTAQGSGAAPASDPLEPQPQSDGGWGASDAAWGEYDDARFQVLLGELRGEDIAAKRRALQEAALLLTVALHESVERPRPGGVEERARQVAESYVTALLLFLHEPVPMSNAAWSELLWRGGTALMLAGQTAPGWSWLEAAAGVSEGGLPLRDAPPTVLGWMGRAEATVAAQPRGTLHVSTTHDALLFIDGVRRPIFYEMDSYDVRPGYHLVVVEGEDRMEREVRILYVGSGADESMSWYPKPPQQAGRAEEDMAFELVGGLDGTPEPQEDTPRDRAWTLGARSAAYYGQGTGLVGGGLAASLDEGPMHLTAELSMLGALSPLWGANGGVSQTVVWTSMGGGPTRAYGDAWRLSAGAGLWLSAAPPAGWMGGGPYSFGEAQWAWKDLRLRLDVRLGMDAARHPDPDAGRLLVGGGLQAGLAL